MSSSSYEKACARSKVSASQETQISVTAAFPNESSQSRGEKKQGRTHRIDLESAVLSETYGGTPARNRRPLVFGELELGRLVELWQTNQGVRAKLDSETRGTDDPGPTEN